MHLFLYGIFGVLTTLLDIFAYWVCSRLLSIPVVPSTVIAWTVAVFFAYWSNKNFVFHSKTSTSSGMLKEAGEFFACRIATGILDVVIMYVFADVLGFYDVAVKITSNIIVIILNYIASKLFIFKGENS